MHLDLSSAERQKLLTLARASIQEAIRRDGSLKSTLDQTDISPPLMLQHGVFITLKTQAGEAEPKPGKLRGCIGVMDSDKPLYRTVIDTAPKAALEDPRFPPLSEEELNEVAISLSILSRPQKLMNPDDVTVGQDGLQLSKGLYRSVFLPQVATEQGWDRQRYLEQLALKAGLPRDGWRGAELSTFRAVVFGEQEG
jgi:AmmeMemoRadiSam system protein A